MVGLQTSNTGFVRFRDPRLAIPLPDDYLSAISRHNADCKVTCAYCEVPFPIADFEFICTYIVNDIWDRLCQLWIMCNIWPQSTMICQLKFGDIWALFWLKQSLITYPGENCRCCVDNSHNISQFIDSKDQYTFTKTCMGNYALCNSSGDIDYASETAFTLPSTPRVNYTG